jgi:hypothetical protein
MMKEKSARVQSRSARVCSLALADSFNGGGGGGGGGGDRGRDRYRDADKSKKDAAFSVTMIMMELM